MTAASSQHLCNLSTEIKVGGVLGQRHCHCHQHWHMSLVDSRYCELGAALGSPVQIDAHALCCICSECAWLATGHEADARVLQQQLSHLVTEQQAAQQFINDNPPPPVPSHHDQQGQPKPGGPVSGGPSIVDWKWDILRPVSLPADLK